MEQLIRQIARTMLNAGVYRGMRKLNPLLTGAVVAFAAVAYVLVSSR